MYFRIIIFTVYLSLAGVAFAQTGNTVRITVKNHDTKEPVAEAVVSVKDSELSAQANGAGVAELANVPDGEQIIVVSSLGYTPSELRLTIPLADTTERTVFLELSNEVGEVIITSTRTGREIEAEPTRVEAMARRLRS